MEHIDLNCDMGEGFGAYSAGDDEALLPYISSASIACGFHAGDAVIMSRTVRMCREHGVSVGAHPGTPDLIGFGRRNMKLTPAEAKAYTMYQTGALMAFCREHGIELHHVKPHGALYNMAATDIALAAAICEGIKAAAPGAAILALSGSCMIQAAHDAGIPCASEVFADRAVRNDGTLVPRSQPGAMIEDESIAIARVIRMVKEGTVTASDGSQIAIKADSVCVHGDSPKALAFVKSISAALKAAGIDIRRF